jgi:hypothetical protein
MVKKKGDPKAELPALENQGQTIVLLRPENQNKQYEALFMEIDSGQIKLPMFQRDFVWDKHQSAKLIDSILKGFPIGTFIFWKTREGLGSYKEIGNHHLPDTPEGDYALYVLDGQQRITSLYAIRKGLRITKDGKEIDYKDIYLSLDYDAKKDEQIAVAIREEGKAYVSVHDLLTKKIGSFYKEFSPESADKLEDYKGKLTTYDFSTIVIKDYPIEVACEVFARINTGGKTLTIFEIMVAMTYDEKKGFDLSEKYRELVSGAEEDDNSLSKAKFDTIPETTVLQAVSAIAVESIRSKDILKIRRADFVSNWEPTKNALFAAVDFLRSELRIPVSQLLPYPVLLVPLAYFFHQIKGKKPTVKQIALLEQFFYWAGLSQRYGGGAESKVADDLKKMKEVSLGKAPKYPSTELAANEEDIDNTWFSTGNAYCKTILCLLASQRPKSFDTSGEVILDNSNLKIASSRNYHHFFPKHYLKKHFPDKDANWIANITLIDAFSNKHKISAKAPGTYISGFMKENKNLSKALRSHLIGDPAAFGILDNDYDTFLDKRCTSIAKKLDEKLMPVFD